MATWRSIGRWRRPRPSGRRAWRPGSTAGRRERAPGRGGARRVWCARGRRRRPSAEREWVMEDKFREECGVFGIYGHTEAANLTYLGLYALQHRGQESVGIVTSDSVRLQIHKAMGYVADAFDEATFARLAGTSSIGHVRYSTAGESG